MATQDSKSILAAWFAGVGLTVWRGWKYRVDSGGKPVHAPPSPGEMLKTVGFFGGLALLNEVVSDPDAHHALALLGWGVDLAALINLISGKPSKIQGGAWPPAMTPDTMLIPDGATIADQSNSPGAIPPGGLGSPNLPGGPAGPGLPPTPSNPNPLNPNQPFGPNNPGGRGGGL